MPQYGRSFPSTLHLDHDYLGYYRDHTREALLDSKQCVDASQSHARPGPLETYGAAEFVVDGDPLFLCAEDLTIFGSSRDEVMAGDFVSGRVYELDSALSRSVARFGR
jgi:hypothetical protein